jgi:hypothetical protein
MNWAWATSLDSIWHSASFPMWLTLAAAAFFGLIALITLLRAEKSVANGALTVITLLAIGIAVAATLRGSNGAAPSASGETRSSVAAAPALPAMSCIDDLAGDTVGQACEKIVFASAESTAAAVSYAASMISRLTALGDVETAQRTMTADMEALRSAVERDRYGLMAQVLSVRYRCTPTDCAVNRSLTDNHQIITNMDEHLFDTIVTRYAPSWNAPPQVATTGSTPLSMLPPSVPTGRPTNAEFPSAANTPAVSIMTPEPGTGTPAPGIHTPPAAANAAAPAVRPAASPSPSPSPAAKKQARSVRPPPPPAAPTQISPAAPAPSASND